MPNKICCIYQIDNIFTGKKYIGGTVNYLSRCRQHKSDLKLNKHGNAILQSEYNTYGKESLEFSIVERLDTDKNLFSIESEWINKLNPKYNMVAAGEYFSPSFIESTMSASAQKNRVKAIREHYKTDEGKQQRKNHSKRMKELWKTSPEKFSVSKEDRIKYGRMGAKARKESGYKHSDKTKRKMSLSAKKTYVGAVSPDGTIYAPIVGMQDFCVEHNLCLSSMVALMRYRRNQHKGWTRYEQK